MCVYCLCECLALLLSSLSVSVLCSFKWSINDNTGSPNPYQGSSGSVVTEPWVDVISLLFCNSGMFSHFFNSNVLAPSLLAPQSNVHSNWLLTHPLTRHTHKYAHTRTVCRHKRTHAHTQACMQTHTHTLKDFTIGLDRNMGHPSHFRNSIGTACSLSQSASDTRTHKYTHTLQVEALSLLLKC